MNNFTLPKLYPITDSRLTGLSHAAQVQQLIAGGAQMIQLRAKDVSAKDFLAAALESVEIARRHHVKIIINDRVDIALAAKADGIHLGQDDLPPEAARQILGEKAIIGFSTHNLEQAVAAAQYPLDYIAVGPIFTTSTKANPDPVLGLDNLQLIRQTIKEFPLVAIGGITEKNARSVIGAGADSVAVISSLLKEPNYISERTQKFLNSL